jgi:hypothetical protein
MRDSTAQLPVIRVRSAGIRPALGLVCSYLVWLVPGIRVYTPGAGEVAAVFTSENSLGPCGRIPVLP